MQHTNNNESTASAFTFSTFAWQLYRERYLLSLKTPSLFSSTADLLALAISFLLYSSLLDNGGDGEYLIRNMFFYVSLVFIGLRLTRSLFFLRLIPKSRVLFTLLGNISGLAVGTILALLFVQFFPAFEEKPVVIIASSVQAFFILGTFSPLVKYSRRDIIL